MKLWQYLSIMAMLCAVSGCVPNSPVAPSEEGPKTISAPGETPGHIQIVVVEGHRFAVVQNGQHVSICEVTAASKAEPEKAKVSP